MTQNNNKPDSMDDLFKKENYEVIQPYRSDSNIFNKKEFEVDIFWEDDKRIVLIRRKIKVDIIND